MERRGYKGAFCVGAHASFSRDNRQLMLYDQSPGTAKPSSSSEIIFQRPRIAELGGEFLNSKVQKKRLGNVQWEEEGQPAKGAGQEQGTEKAAGQPDVSPSLSASPIKTKGRGEARSSEG